MSLLGNLSVGILGNMSGLSDTFRGAQSEVEKFAKDIDRMGKSITDVGKTMSLLVTGPLVAIGGTSLKTASDFESAFAGVRKTVDATEEEFAMFRQGIRDMAKEMPQSATEIAKVAEAAGQLGIENDAILGFTKTMVNMGVATNMSSDDAAMALARLATITQMNQQDFDRLGATIVGLGNNLAATESEIVEMGLRLAGAGSTIGMTEAQILSFAGSLAAVGINAEAGGSAFSKLMVNMANEVATGGKKLVDFAKVSGMSVAEFQKAFKDDAATAIVSFIEGLGKMQDSGENVFGVLEDLGLTEVRLRDSLLRAAGAGDLFRESLELGNKAWEENTALTDEAEQRYKTFASQLQIFWNNIKDVAITLGDVLMPAFLSALDAAQPFIDMLTRAAEWFAQLDPSAQLASIAIATFAAAIGPVLVVLGTIVSSISTLIPLFSALLGPVGLVVTAIGALVAAGVMLYQNWDTLKEKAEVVFSAFAPLIETVKEAFQNFIDSLEPIWESLKELFESLMPVLTAIGAIVGGAIVTAFGVFIATVNAVISALGPLINAAINLLDVFVNVFNAIISLMIGDFSGALDYWKQATESSIAFFKNLWEGVVNFFASFVKTIIDFFHGLYMTLVGNSIIPDMVNAIVKWFQNMFKWITDIVKNIIDGVKKGFENMKNNVKAVFDLVKNIITAALNFIKNTFKNTLGFLKSVVTGDFEGMKNAITNQMENIKSTITNIWNNVLSSLKNINLKDVGKNVIRGFADGITSMASSVMDKARSIADSVKNTISKALDIRSPSRVLMAIGKDVVEGFAIGIEKQIKAVASVARDMASSVTHEADVNLSLPDVAGVLNQARGKGREGLSSSTSSTSSTNGVSLLERLANLVPEYIQTTINLDGKKIAEVTSRNQYNQQKSKGRGLGYT